MVGKFLAGECRLMDIYKTIKQVMEAHVNIKNPTLEDIRNSIAWSQGEAEIIFNA
jgi:1-deoxy-D-xylulose 5-phosphate reductoisomerase